MTLYRTVAACLVVCGLAASQDRKPAPDFTLTDAHGKSLKLSDLRGQVVLLDFWATWCGGCKVEIPWYIEFQKHYQKEGLAVLGVSMDDGGWEVVKPFLKKKKINYPVVLGDDEVSKLYDVSAMPLTLLIDRAGNIAASHSGIVNKGDFEREIRALLLK